MERPAAVSASLRTVSRRALPSTSHRCRVGGGRGSCSRGDQLRLSLFLEGGRDRRDVEPGPFEHKVHLGDEPGDPGPGGGEAEQPDPVYEVGEVALPVRERARKCAKERVCACVCVCVEERENV